MGYWAASLSSQSQLGTQVMICEFLASSRCLCPVLSTRCPCTLCLSYRCLCALVPRFLPLQKTASPNAICCLLNRQNTAVFTLFVLLSWGPSASLKVPQILLCTQSVPSPGVDVGKSPTSFYALKHKVKFHNLIQIKTQPYLLLINLIASETFGVNRQLQRSSLYHIFCKALWMRRRDARMIGSSNWHWAPFRQAFRKVDIWSLASNDMEPFLSRSLALIDMKRFLSTFCQSVRLIERLVSIINGFFYPSLSLWIVINKGWS